MTAPELFTSTSHVARVLLERYEWMAGADAAGRQDAVVKWVRSQGGITIAGWCDEILIHGHHASGLLEEVRGEWEAAAVIRHRRAELDGELTARLDQATLLPSAPRGLSQAQLAGAGRPAVVVQRPGGSL